MKIFYKKKYIDGTRKLFFFSVPIWKYKRQLGILKDPYFDSIATHIRNNFYPYQEDKKILLKNLDVQSAETISNVLTLYEHLASNSLDSAEIPENYIEAKKEIIKIFYSKIIQVEENFKFKDYLLPINHFETSVFLHEHGLKTINKSSIQPDEYIIDVGGFIADSVLVFRKNFPENPIISFEAARENYTLAQKTLQLNHVKNVTLEKTALGDNEGEIYINSFADSSTSTSAVKQNPNAQICSLTTLDNYVKKHNIQKVGLIKVDIEGAEQMFLKGALETIKRDRPVLLLSIYHNYSDLMHIKPFIESLNLNYKISIHKPQDILFFEILLICEPTD